MPIQRATPVQPDVVTQTPPAVRTSVAAPVAPQIVITTDDGRRQRASEAQSWREMSAAAEEEFIEAPDRLHPHVHWLDETAELSEEDEEAVWQAQIDLLEAEELRRGYYRYLMGDQ